MSESSAPHREVVTWDEIERLIAELAARLDSARFDLMLAITRGGLVPAGMLAYRLGIRNILVAAVEFYDDHGQPGPHPTFLQFPADPLLRGQRILVVDEVWDSGTTIHAVTERVRQAGGILMGRHLAEVAKAKGWDLLSTIAHPGYTRTNLQTAGRNLGRDATDQLRPGRRTILPSQDAEVGAEPLLYAATSPMAQQGAYYGPSRLGVVGPTRQAKIPRSGRSLELAARLWDVAEQLQFSVEDAGPFYHGSKVDLTTGDTLDPGFSSNFGEKKTASFVYMTGTLDAAIWGAELAVGEGPGRIYRVEATGGKENDPNLTNMRFPGNATRSYRTREPLRVVGEVTGWKGHNPQVLQTMRDNIEKMKQQSVEAIND